LCLIYVYFWLHITARTLLLLLNVLRD
jgi:hypothetical protein